MKKSLIEILALSGIFKSLTNKHYTNFALAFKIAQASKELDGHRDFYIKEERKLVESYAVKDKDGQVEILEGNRIKFKDEEDKIAFNKEITSLQKTEVDIFDPIEIRLSDFKAGEINLTPDDILKLGDVVSFVDDTTKKGPEA